jgi:hypothetical protein
MAQNRTDLRFTHSIEWREVMDDPAQMAKSRTSSAMCQISSITFQEFPFFFFWLLVLTMAMMLKRNEMKRKEQTWYIRLGNLLIRYGDQKKRGAEFIVLNFDRRPEDCRLLLNSRGKRAELCLSLGLLVGWRFCSLLYFGSCDTS